MISITLEGQQLRYCGLGHSYDDIHIQGNPAELKVGPEMNIADIFTLYIIELSQFVAFYFKAGKVVAVAR